MSLLQSLTLTIRPKTDQHKWCSARHQSGNNSGVLHAGIYYQPGSLKARLCVQGIDLAYQYLDEKKIPYKKCGKLIVALDESEIPNLDVSLCVVELCNSVLFGFKALWERAQKNGCRDIVQVDAAKIREIQPHCRVSQIPLMFQLLQGVKAIWSPYTGIVDWKVVTQSYAQDFQERGGTVLTSHPLRNIDSSPDPAFPIRIGSEPGKVSQTWTCG